ncbi:DIBOA-glucoside dioxygenase BX6-like [Lolium perenne]|uniref:DIBOA-glucoside dioxygenase BX6-like n=1 Tax=Lolium perenne TaxID=4522 RepID=UPI0021F53586|nr:DIBOA-glucoside dioxygenase BX6-like [Lolium perenne]
MAATNTTDRRQALQAFDDTKAGVKGLVDAGVIIVPPIFHHPPDSLPTSSSSVTIPVIDLFASRSDVLAQVKAAAETVGFFQVVNHGVPAVLLAETLASVRRFHESPPESKAPYYTRDLAKKLRFNSNFDLFQSPAANWRDTLFCQALPDPPGEDELPPAVRGVLPAYSGAARRLAVAVLELLSEALGLAPGRLAEMGCADGVVVVGNYYPPCPEPRRTLGTSRHSDPAFLTVLLQDYDMPGLQVLVGGEEEEEDGRRRAWADVPPVAGALVINVGDLLQLVSNGRLRSVEHRVVANGSRDGRARVSVAAFCNADLSARTAAREYGPIEELVSSSSAPALYRSVTVPEFLSHYDDKGLDGRPALDYFRLPRP